MVRFRLRKLKNSKAGTHENYSGFHQAALRKLPVEVLGPIKPLSQIAHNIGHR
jgi:hypothetical protein